MLSWAGTFTQSRLVPSGTSMGFFAQSLGCREPHDSLQVKLEADSHTSMNERKP